MNDDYLKHITELPKKKESETEENPKQLVSEKEENKIVYKIKPNKKFYHMDLIGRHIVLQSENESDDDIFIPVEEFKRIMVKLFTR